MGNVGLITIHNTVNYGSLLQTYATYVALTALGCDVTLIDYRCPKIEKREAVPSLSGKKGAKDIAKYILWHRKLQKKHDEFWTFINENMKITDTYSRENIDALNKKFDSFVVGSDIVWGSNITGHDMTFFLDFADEKKKKYSFSSSIGTLWDENDRAVICNLLHRFDKISVREDIAKDWIKQYAKIDAATTCDPTMLYDGEYWKKHCDNKLLPKEKYVLIYLENPDKKNITDGIAYAKEHGYTAYFVNFYKKVKGAKSVAPESVQQWISLIMNAEAVFSASYHGLLFSLYFHRNVFYYNRGEKSRMLSLGKELGIEYREGTDENVRLDKPINYHAVDALIAEKRNQSWAYLKSIAGEF